MRVRFKKLMKECFLNRIRVIRKSADRLIVFLSAISLFAIVILPHLVESMPLFGKQQ